MFPLLYIVLGEIYISRVYSLSYVLSASAMFWLTKTVN